MFPLLPLLNLAVASPDPMAEWRLTVFAIGVGTILLTIGLIATGIFLFRKKTTDRTLLYFGIFVIIYAIRIFLREPALMSLFAIPPAVAQHGIRVITLTLSIPAILLFLEFVQAS